MAAEMGQELPPALQKIWNEFRPEARRALFSGTCGGSRLPVQRLGGMTDATAEFIAGLASLARPGGNATGVNYFQGEVLAKRELVPKAVRVAMTRTRAGNF
jgi:hypothetical protein